MNAPDTSLSAFETSAATVTAGKPADYRLTAAHAGSRRWVTLRFDIHSLADPSPAGCYASFRKDVSLPSAGSRAIDVRYDWNATATLTIDDVELSPDVFTPGPHRESGTYLVSASLTSRDGTPVERLSLRQRLVS